MRKGGGEGEASQGQALNWVTAGLNHSLMPGNMPEAGIQETQPWERRLGIPFEP